MKRTFDAEDIVAIIDTREQRPLDLSPLRTERGTLVCGDYSVAGLTHQISYERKSLDDLAMSCSRERDRFSREIQRLLAYPVRGVVIEGAWSDVVAGNYRSKASPASVTGSVLAWMADGVPFLFAGSAAEAGRAVSRLLFLAARRRWRELQSFQTVLAENQSNSREASGL